MSVPFWASHPPCRLLLVFDPSSRRDRALDRAVQLAGDWDARLTVLHVMDAAGGIGKLHRDDLPSGVGDVEVVIEEGEPAATIDRVARARDVGLIVTGVAGDETLGRARLGATLRRLMRRTLVPVLVVRSRPDPYEQVLVASDFSESSRHALHAALGFFPRAPVILLHAYDAPTLHTGDDLSAAFHKMSHEAAERFLADSGLAPEQRRRVALRIERGSPESAVRRQMSEQDIRLAVIGSHGASAVFDVLIGSTARRVLESASADVLLIREPRAVEGC